LIQAICIAGIFVNLTVRKPLVIDYKLPYPTGTATGVMINSFFTNGDLAKQQASVWTSSHAPCSAPVDPFRPCRPIIRAARCWTMCGRQFIHASD